METPLVSVIVPNYNHSKYLGHRIDSILNQSYANFELIILDDCSTDNSRAIIESYRGYPKIRSIIFNKKNSGSPFKQWSKGIEAANGKYIWVAESDDWAESTFIESLIPYLENEAEAVLAYCNSILINEKGQEIRIWEDSWTKNCQEDEVTLVPGNKLIAENFLYSNIIPNASAVIFRKDQIDPSFFRQIKMKLNGDWLFWIKLIEGKKVIFLNKSYNYFRHHSTTVRNKFEAEGRNLTEYLSILNYLERRLTGQIQSINIQRKTTIKLLLAKMVQHKIPPKIIFPFLKATWPNYHIPLATITQWAWSKVLIFQNEK